MALSTSSILHYWSARYGATPVYGGKPVHTRSSAARIADQRGVLHAPIINTPRIGWDTVAGERRPTMLLELARTNSLTYSQEIDNAAWTKSNATVTANAILAPDGTLTADKVAEDTATSTHYVGRTGIAATASTQQAISFFAKPAERDWVWVQTSDKAGTAANSWINVRTGATGTVAASHTIRTVSFGDGWYRVEITMDSGVGAGTMAFYPASVTDNNVTSFAGTSGYGFYLWGAQFEVDGSYVTSYIPTTSATATRSADVFYWDHTPIPQAVMVYMRFVERGTVGVSGSRILFFGNSAAAAPRLAIKVLSARYTVEHHNGTAGVEVSMGTAGTVGDTTELLAILFSDGSAQLVQSLNGAAVTSTAATAANALPTAWSDKRAYLNSEGTGGQGFNRYAEVKVVKYADVVGATAQARMDELRDFQVNSAGEVLS